MVKYLNNHPDKFTRLSPPILISFMQQYAALYTELVNIILICGSPNILEVILNFVALWVIADIDDQYSEALQDFTLKKALRHKPVITNKSKDIPFKNRNCKGKAIRIYYILNRIMYISFYYYFTPFLTVLLTYIVGNPPKAGAAEE